MACDLHGTLPRGLYEVSPLIHCTVSPDNLLAFRKDLGHILSPRLFYRFIMPCKIHGPAFDVRTNVCLEKIA